MNFSDGTPYELKGSCTVWVGGKDGDYIKVLPIDISRNAANQSDGYAYHSGVIVQRLAYQADKVIENMFWLSYTESKIKRKKGGQDASMEDTHEERCCKRAYKR
jgi:hypothetical protein